MQISKQKQAVVEAYTRGYRVNSNVVFNVRGEPVKGFYIKSSRRNLFYHHFSVKIGGSSWNVRTHLLVAYQKFKEKLFEEGIQVRHLNNNSTDNNESNIELGTAQQNAMDRSPEDRRKHAIKASQHIHRLKTKEEITEFLTDRANGMSFKKLAQKWGMNLSTISCLFNQAEYIATTAQDLGLDIEVLKKPVAHPLHKNE